MNSIGLAVALLMGAEGGLWLVGQHPAGLEPGYGYAMLALAGLTLLVALVAWPEKRVRWACLLLMMGLVGCGRALISHPSVTTHDLAYFNSEGSEGGSTARIMMITGSIAAEPVFGDRWQRVRVSAETVRVQTGDTPQEVGGDVLVLLPRYPVFDVEERLVLSGTVTAPPEIDGFDYRAYLARQGIYSYMSYPKVKSLGASEATGLRKLMAGVRSKVREALREGVAEPQAALVVGVVTGDRTSIPQDVQEAFRRSGTMHILAISGQNISLIVGSLWLFYSSLTKRRKMPLWLFVLTALVLAGYTAFTGATPSVVRAAFMGGVLLMAPLVLRRYDPIAALAVSAAGMIALDPDVLGDMGFQLSFASMLGISLVAPHLYQLAQRLHMPAVLALPLSVSLSAQAATLPIWAAARGQVSLVSPLATLCADVALLPLMITGIADGVLGSISGQVAVLLGYTVWPFASWLLWCAQWWGSLPWASVDLPEVSLGWVLVYFGVVGVVLWVAENRRRMEWLPSGGVLALAGVALGLWTVLVGMLLST